MYKTFLSSAQYIQCISIRIPNMHEVSQKKYQNLPMLLPALPAKARATRSRNLGPIRFLAWRAASYLRVPSLALTGGTLAQLSLFTCLHSPKSKSNTGRTRPSCRLCVRSRALLINAFCRIVLLDLLSNPIDLLFL